MKASRRVGDKLTRHLFLLLEADILLHRKACFGGSDLHFPQARLLLQGLSSARHRGVSGSRQAGITPQRIGDALHESW
jgi:hypothetical protein